MKNLIKQPKVCFTNIPYLVGSSDNGEELAFTTTSIPEDIFVVKNQATYIDVICDLHAHMEFNPVTVTASYKNEPGDLPISIAFSLYDNSSIDINGIVSHIDIIACEILLQNDRIPKFEPHVIYTKKFPTMSQSCSIKTFETENFSGFDTLSEVHFFGGSFKPSMPLSEIQPYLFYIGHNYNDKEFISIISASDLINSKNDLRPAQNVKFEDLSTLYDDIVTGKIHIEINTKRYKSIFATKSTVTNSLFTIKFKAI